MPARLYWNTFLAFLGLMSTVYACRYSIRDVGFVDLENAPYWLFLYVPAELEAELEKNGAFDTVHAELIDTNLLGGILLVEDQNPSNQPEESTRKKFVVRFPRMEDGHPGDQEILTKAEAFLNQQEKISLPAGILLASDGRVRVLAPDRDPAEDGGQAQTRALQSIAHQATTSPLREQLANDILDVHSIVLLIEGTDAGRNREAKELAMQAIERIESSMGGLPKQIAKPPKLAILPRKDASREGVFLWSLGVPDNQREAAHLVILYGRLRMMGNILAVPDATWLDLAEPLYWIGLDCECELDRSLMRGIMAPHVWDRRLEAKAAELLGFDPGHPFVKAEVSRIVHRGMDYPMPSSLSDRPTLGMANPGLGGYTEIEIEPLAEDSSDTDEATAGQVSDPAASDSSNDLSTDLLTRPAGADRSQLDQAPIRLGTDSKQARQKPPGQPRNPGEPAPSGFRSTSHPMLWTSGVLVALVLGLSAMVLLRARGRF